MSALPAYSRMHAGICQPHPFDLDQKVMTGTNALSQFVVVLCQHVAFLYSHRTAKDFKMMRDMKKKLNPRNSVSEIFYTLPSVCVHHRV